MSTPLILLIGDGPLVAPVLTLLEPHVAFAAVFPVGEQPVAAPITPALLRDALPLSDPDAMVAALSPHAGATAVVVGSLARHMTVVGRGSIRHVLINPDGLGAYGIVSKAVEDAGLFLKLAGEFLPPKHTIDSGVLRGREPTHAERDEAVALQIRCARLTKDCGTVVFRLDGVKRRRRRFPDGDPNAVLRSVSAEAAPASYLYLRGAPMLDGLGGCPLVTENFLRDAQRRGIRGVFIETARHPLALGVVALAEDTAQSARLVGEDLNPDFFVYGL